MTRSRMAAASVAVFMALMSTVPALAQRGRLGVDPEDTKSAVEIKKIFIPIVRAASKSTVVVRVQREGVLVQAGYGTVVDANGYVLTKASEVLGYPLVRVKVKGQELDASIVGYDETLDLAMLKVESKDLTPVKFAETHVPAIVAAELPVTRGGPIGAEQQAILERAAALIAGAATTATAPATQPGAAPAPAQARGGRGRNRDSGGPLPVVAKIAETPQGSVKVAVGEWVATTEAGGSYEGDLYPKVIGVISTPRRLIERIQGYLGIRQPSMTYDDSGTRVIDIIPGSNAERAGIKADDVIVAINGTPTPTVAKMREVLAMRSRGDTVVLNIRRGERNLTIRCTLGGDPDPGQEEQEMMILSGIVNRRSGNFPAVYQHDSVLPSDCCGGPLVDLEGRVIGINIARAGRTESYAIPADLIAPLIGPMKAGKMPPPTDMSPR